MTPLPVVTLTGHQATPRKPVDQVVRYAFVRDGDARKIDDIRGSSDGEPWSIRDVLAASLKN